MIINLTAQRRDDNLRIRRVGEALVINGESYDFSHLLEGEVLPKHAIDCEWIVSDVKRLNGKLFLTLILPHSADASEIARFPLPIEISTDGEVVLP